MHNKLYQCLALLALLCLSMACKPTSAQGKWIPQDKQQFLEFCKESRKNKNIQLSGQQIDRVCHCALKQAIKSYESFEAANADSIRQIGTTCVDEINKMP
ncbi:hypothetical protein [Microscilla marina]|nr:hypothetical protein [Microscilla marina]